MLMKKNWFLTGLTVCMEVVRSLHVCMGFLSCPKDVHNRTMACLVCSSVIVCGDCDGRASCPVWVLPCTLSCWDRLCPHKTLNWNKQVGKSLSYLFVQIFLRCACSSHLFYSLVLEVFLVWVYIWKLDVLLDVTRNMLLELNSSLHHLAYGKIGSVIHCFASSCSFQEPILDIEDLLYYVSGP